MTGDTHRTIVVTGATGLQGSAVTRRLLADGWRVVALTRDPTSKKAQAIASEGADVVQGDMAVRNSLVPLFKGAYGVFSVQNPMISGIEGEIIQGKNVASAAQEVGVEHVVYGSAGVGLRDTGVPSWESKLVVEDYMKSLGLPLTVLRPMAFMQLMNEQKFFPAVSTWHVMPKLMGSSRKIGWISVDDCAAVVAAAFARSGEFVGRELQLASDVQSIDECRSIYRATMGKNPPSWPMPAWMFERLGFVGKDLTIMWRWLRETQIPLDTVATRAIVPAASSVQTWLSQQKSKIANGPR